MDTATVSAMLESGHRMDEETADRAFWSVVQAVDKAEAEDKPLPVEGEKENVKSIVAATT
jgi:hypothetical protein